MWYNKKEKGKRKIENRKGERLLSAFKLYGKDTLCQQLAQMEDGTEKALWLL